MCDFAHVLKDLFVVSDKPVTAFEIPFEQGLFHKDIPRLIGRNACIADLSSFNDRKAEDAHLLPCHHLAAALFPVWLKIP